MKTIIERIAKAQFFTISLFLHILLVLSLGSAVLYREMVPKDQFVSTEALSTFLEGEAESAGPPAEEPVEFEDLTAGPMNTEVASAPPISLAALATDSATASSNFSVTAAGATQNFGTSMAGTSTDLGISGLGAAGAGSNRTSLGGKASGVQFFQAKTTGERFAFLIDSTWSGSGKTFEKHRDEFLKTLSRMQSSSADIAVVYFGGREGGHVKGNKDQLEKDFWFPNDSKNNEWMPIGSRAAMDMEKELREVSPNDKRQTIHEKGWFVLGTQYWGALNAAMRMNPKPDAIFLLVEPKIGFAPVNDKTEISKDFKDALESYKQVRGARLGTVPVFVICAGNEEKEHKATALSIEASVAELNGGRVSKERLEELLTYTDQ